MGRQAITTIYVLSMVVVSVAIDFSFFRNWFWERLMVNAGIVLACVAFYLRYLR